jgi:UDP-N-acetylglucosamine 2-epimerase (non-hydrolysing)
MMATFHFAVTELAADNLRSEKIPPERIYVTGNTVVDSFVQILRGGYSAASASGASLRDTDSCSNTIGDLYALAAARGGRHRQLVLLTAHRRENLFGPLTMRNIMDAVFELLRRHSDCVVIYPLHRNPHVKASIQETLPSDVFDIMINQQRQIDEQYAHLDRLILTDPLNYPDLLQLLKDSALVLTDSGGLQEESACLGRPLLVLREVTERPEVLMEGIGELVGSDKHAIFGNASAVLSGEGLALTAKPSVAYGTGDAAQKIVNVILAKKEELFVRAYNK